MYHCFFSLIPPSLPSSFSFSKIISLSSKFPPFYFHSFPSFIFYFFLFSLYHFVFSSRLYNRLLFPPLIFSLPLFSLVVLFHLPSRSFHTAALLSNFPPFDILLHSPLITCLDVTHPRTALARLPVSPLDQNSLSRRCPKISRVLYTHSRRHTDPPRTLARARGATMCTWKLPVLREGTLLRS